MHVTQFEYFFDLVHYFQSSQSVGGDHSNNLLLRRDKNKQINKKMLSTNIIRQRSNRYNIWMYQKYSTAVNFKVKQSYSHHTG